MKGSAKIELRDAKSGRLVKQIEKHNIVTNGALNVMKIKQAYGYYIGDSSYSLIEKYFGGILLFGASIDEDVKNAIPSAAVRASYIGHASCLRTITGDSLMGTYVAGESSIGAHNATLVFSFDTSQANGNINCICLTSGDGGTFGYGVTALTSSDAQNTAYSFKTFNYSRLRYQSSYYPVKFKDDKSYNYYQDNAYISDFSVAKNLGLNLSIKDSGSYYNYSRAEKATSTPATYEHLSDKSTYWSLDEDRVVCWAEGKNTSEGNKNIVEFEVLDAGETTSDKITLDYTNMVADFNQKSGANYDHYNNLFGASSTNWALFKDYALNIQRYNYKCYLCIANISKGTYVVKLLEDKALADSFSYEQEFANILGTIYLRGNYKESSGKYLYYRINLDTAEVADIPEFFTDIYCPKIYTTLDPDMPPIINTDDASSGYLAPYLATINNVDTLEKNASRTLKITYNLEY